MSQTTSKLGLVLPGGGSTGLITPPDRVDIDVINGNFKKIDDYATLWGNPNEYAPTPVAITDFQTGGSSSNLKVWRIGKVAFLSGALQLATGQLPDYNKLLTVPDGYRPLTDVPVGTFVYGGTGNTVYGMLVLKTNGVLGVSTINASPPTGQGMNLNFFWRLD